MINEERARMIQKLDNDLRDNRTKMNREMQLSKTYRGSNMRSEYAANQALSDSKTHAKYESLAQANKKHRIQIETEKQFKKREFMARLSKVTLFLILIAIIWLLVK